jgi:hypothetical protein
MLTAEAAAHEDLVVVRGADAYRNLPNKTVRLLRYMLSSARGRAPRRPPGPLCRALRCPSIPIPKLTRAPARRRFGGARAWSSSACHHLRCCTLVGPCTSCSSLLQPEAYARLWYPTLRG